MVAKGHYRKYVSVFDMQSLCSSVAYHRISISYIGQSIDNNFIYFLNWMIFALLEGLWNVFVLPYEKDFWDFLQRELSSLMSESW